MVFEQPIDGDFDQCFLSIFDHLLVFKSQFRLSTNRPDFGNYDATSNFSVGIVLSDQSVDQCLRK